ncbi:solute carrier family 22 member 15-like [Gigantopelta aegis]|uniref:solute carrier family 22 member 15-like n=1 Tax=Gigantopelta aegis TaxID=1735272 RepID=UPI001B88B8C5|nr:solute carrier family 22 member 15-like [Gigantopelta aegis]
METVFQMSEKNKNGTLEILLGELGSFGRFQIIMMQCLFIPNALVGFSLVLPSFTSVAPDWWCVPVAENNNNQSQHTNETFKVCSVNGSECVRVYGSNMATTVSEWDLVCDNRWVTKIMTSIQMAGILVGVVIAGQMSDSFGRKKIFFSGVLAHSICNLICPFSVSWEMFAVLLCLLGINAGVILCLNFSYLLEFVEEKWRPVLSAMPHWSLSVALVAMLAWLIPNWKYLHAICGAAEIPFVVGYFFMTESMRWLVVHDRVDEADKVANTIARYNRVKTPDDLRKRLQAVADEEKSGQQNAKKYSYIDVFRGKTMIKTTICSSFVWYSCSIVYYGMMFGAHRLTGNLYLNIFLLTICDLPILASIFWFLRRFGRKWSGIAFLFVGGLCLVATVIIKNTANTEYKDDIIRTMAVLAQMTIGGAWITMYIYTNELYPTVVRTVGVGVSQTFARVGGIMAPLVLLMDGDNIIVPYVTMGCFIIISVACLFLLPETKGRPLEDTLKKKAKVVFVEIPKHEEGRSFEAHIPETETISFL